MVHTVVGAEIAVKHPGGLECDALVMNGTWRGLGHPDNPHTSSTYLSESCTNWQYFTDPEKK